VAAAVEFLTGPSAAATATTAAAHATPSVTTACCRHCCLAIPTYAPRLSASGPNKLRIYHEANDAMQAKLAGRLLVFINFRTLRSPRKVLLVVSVYDVGVELSSVPAKLIARRERGMHAAASGPHLVAFHTLCVASALKRRRENPTRSPSFIIIYINIYVI
jgi:hypothetical protein